MTYHPAAVATDPPLSDDERKVLNIMMLPDRGVADCTTEAIASALGAEYDATDRILRGLEERRPQLAHPEADAGLGKQVWFTTHEAAEAFEE